MEKFIVIAIRFIAGVLFFGGIVLFFVCRHLAWDAGIGYITRDPAAVSMWNFLSIQCIVSAISSVFVFGFSYIVQAACIYVKKY